jgi:hypothetical protein
MAHTRCRASLGVGQGHRQPWAELVAQTADSPAAARRRHVVAVTAGYYQLPLPSNQPSADRVFPVWPGPGGQRAGLDRI